MNPITKIPQRSQGRLALALLLVVACGCGKRMVKVEGKVLLDDKPLDGAAVLFQPDDGGRPATGMTGSDGVFSLTTFTTGDGARTGDYKVIITKKKDSVAAQAPATMGNQDSMKEAWKKFIAKPAKAPPKETSTIPSEYGDPEKTPLRCRLPLDGPLELKLRSKGGA
jgi:hypothetical protein